MFLCKLTKDKVAIDPHQVDDDEDTKQLPLVKDETRGGRRHPQKQGSAIDLDIGEQFPFCVIVRSNTKRAKFVPLFKDTH